MSRRGLDDDVALTAPPPVDLLFEDPAVAVERLADERRGHGRVVRENDWSFYGRAERVEYPTLRGIGLGHARHGLGRLSLLLPLAFPLERQSPVRAPSRL